MPLGAQGSRLTNTSTEVEIKKPAKRVIKRGESSWGRRITGEKEVVRKIIRNLVSRSGFWPFMWDFMWESHPKLAKIQTNQILKLLQEVRKLRGFAYESVGRVFESRWARQ
jgi:hypothetical protein